MHMIRSATKHEKTFKEQDIRVTLWEEITRNLDTNATRNEVKQPQSETYPNYVL
ncbi:hypothetical protein ABKV19_004272 [Rosa sericea]